jgi:hypothetical protein
VNSGKLLSLFVQLGWTNNIPDLLQAALTSGVPCSSVALYLEALLATPDGMNDQAIPNVTPANGAAITAFLKGKGLVGT